MQLLQKNLRLNGVEISDLRIPCFGFVFRVECTRRLYFLLSKSDKYLLHIEIPNATLGTPTMASKPVKRLRWPCCRWEDHPRGGQLRRRPGAAALPPRGPGARGRERFGEWPVASKNSAELFLLSGGVVRWKVPTLRSKILKFGG